MSADQVETAVARMRAWAERHGEADTQGLMDDEWDGLARAALGLPDQRWWCDDCAEEVYGPDHERKDGSHEVVAQESPDGWPR